MRLPSPVSWRALSYGMVVPGIGWRPATARPVGCLKYLLVKKDTKQYLFDLRRINSQLAAERNPLRHARPTLPEIDMRTPPPVCLLGFATAR